MKSLVLAAFLGLTSYAQAEVVTYEYTARVYRMFEYDGVSGKIKYVDRSAMPGYQFTVGDIYTGRFSYDLNLSLHSYQPDQPAAGTYRIYTGDIRSSFNYLPNGFVYTSVGMPSMHQMQVANDASVFSADIVAITTNALMTATGFDINDFMFRGRDPSSLQDGGPPHDLSLSKFSAETSYSYVRRADSSQMHTRAIISDLRRVTDEYTDVPEPASALLFLAGLAGLSVFRRPNA